MSTTTRLVQTKEDKAVRVASINDSDQSHGRDVHERVITLIFLTRADQPMTTETLELECRRELNGLPQDEDHVIHSEKVQRSWWTKLK